MKQNKQEDWMKLEAAKRLIQYNKELTLDMMYPILSGATVYIKRNRLTHDIYSKVNYNMFSLYENIVDESISNDNDFGFLINSKDFGLLIFDIKEGKDNERRVFWNASAYKNQRDIADKDIAISTSMERYKNLGVDKLVLKNNIRYNNTYDIALYRLYKLVDAAIDLYLEERRDNTSLSISALSMYHEGKDGTKEKISKYKDEKELLDNGLIEVLRVKEEDGKILLGSEVFNEFIAGKLPLKITMFISNIVEEAIASHGYNHIGTALAYLMTRHKELYQIRYLLENRALSDDYDKTYNLLSEGGMLMNRHHSINKRSVVRLGYNYSSFVTYGRFEMPMATIKALTRLLKPFDIEKLKELNDNQLDELTLVLMYPEYNYEYFKEIVAPLLKKGYTPSRVRNLNNRSAAESINKAQYFLDSLIAIKSDGVIMSYLTIAIHTLRDYKRYYISDDAIKKFEDFLIKGKLDENVRKKISSGIIPANPIVSSHRPQTYSKTFRENAMVYPMYR